MARIDYDPSTASAYKAVREVPREGLAEWRAAVERHLHPSTGMTLVDIGAGTGQFATAFADWFGIHVLAVEPSAAMRARIPAAPSIDVCGGEAEALPLPDASADAAWISLALHHIPDLEAAAREIRRVLRPGAPLLLRQGFPDRYRPVGPLRPDSIELVRWFPETARALDSYPTLAGTLAAFATAGFQLETIESVPERYAASLAELLEQIDVLRAADTTMRQLTDDEFAHGKERLRGAAASAEPRRNWLDLVVLR